MRAPMMWRWERRTVLAPLRGAVRFVTGFRGCRCAQPPANIWQPSGLTRNARPQIKRHARERAHRAEGVGEGGELEGWGGHPL